MSDNCHALPTVFMRRGVAFLLGAAALWVSGMSANATPSADAHQALVYDAQTRSPVPIPLSERDLQTVTAEPWVRLPATGDLEGPVFERDGNLIFSDVMGHRILRVTPDGTISTLAERPELFPGGLAIRRDGRIFIASINPSTKTGTIVSLRPDGSDVQTEVPASAGFLPNDIVFDQKGGYYFTDFRGSATDPRGGIYYIPPHSRKPVAVVSGLAMANGVALSPEGRELWATEFGRNALYRVQLADATHPTPLGTAIAYYFTGPAPDSMRIDGGGNLYVALYGQGRILAFGHNGVPIGQILLPERDAGHNLNTTNMAIKPGTHDVYIVAADDPAHTAGLFHSGVFGRGLPLNERCSRFLKN